MKERINRKISNKKEKWRRVDYQYFKKGKYVLNNVNDIIFSILDSKLKIFKKKDVIIGDFGGGKGDLLLRIKQLFEDKYNLKFYLENIDINREYLKSRYKDLKYIFCDLVEYREPNRYDIIIIRSILHYNPPESQLKILENAVLSLNKEDGTLIIVQPVLPSNKKDIDKIKKLYEYLFEYTGQKKIFPNSYQIEEMLSKISKKIPIEIIHKFEIPQYYMLDNFFRERYLLTEEQILNLKRLVGDNKIFLPTKIIVVNKPGREK